MRRNEILRIGNVWRDSDGDWIIDGWVMCGESPGLDLDESGTILFGGWTGWELRLVQRNSEGEEWKLGSSSCV